MLKSRIIPCLDVNDGRVVKGVKFQNLRDAGDPVELSFHYEQQGADELVLLKSSDSPDSNVDFSHLGKIGYVDSYFATAARGLAVRFVNLRSFD